MSLQKAAVNLAYTTATGLIVFAEHGLSPTAIAYVALTAVPLALRQPYTLFYTASLVGVHTPLLARTPLSSIPMLLSLLLFDVEIRRHRKVLAWKMGYGLSLLLAAITAQTAGMLLGAYTAAPLLETTLYLLAASVYEASLHRRITVTAPKTVVTHTGEEKTITVEVDAPRNLIVLPHPRYRQRAYYTRDKLVLELKIREEKLGTYTRRIDILVSGKRKIIALVRPVLVEVTVTPRLPEAVKNIRGIAVTIQTIEDVREITEAGARAATPIRGAVYSLRQFLPGDNPRDIYYKKSVTRQMLVVKEYTRQAAARLELEERGLEQITASVLFLADLTSKTPEQLDRIGYETLKLLSVLISAGVFPRVFIAVAGDRRIGEVINLKKPGHLMRVADMVSTVRTITPRLQADHEALSRELPARLKPIVYQKYRNWIPRKALLKSARMFGHEASTVLILRHGWWRNRLYGYLANEMRRRGFYVQEIRVGWSQQPRA